MNREMERKRVLIVNCFFDDSRLPVRRRTKLMQAAAPIYLAGGFDRQRCDLRLYNEQYDGPIPPKQLAWPDMLVLTGLTNSLDRMRQLVAYARTQNPRVVTVAGGPAIRAVPLYAGQFFDYACQGDVEQIVEVISDAFGPQYAGEEPIPHYDLANWSRVAAYVETSRNCNFRCAFCSIAAEGRKYQCRPWERVRREVLAAGRHRLLLLLDNNLYGCGRRHIEKRLWELQQLHAEGGFGYWGGCVTNDFFLDRRNVARAKASGCIGLFSGVESFNKDWLLAMNKTQNGILDPVEAIRNCTDEGVLFSYGMMFDVSRRTVPELRRELQEILVSPDIPFPSFFAVPIPLPKTPFFYECLSDGMILPNTRWRDLDPTTISLQTASPLSEAADLVRDLQTLRGHRAALVRHIIRYCVQNHTLGALQKTLIALNGWEQLSYNLKSNVSAMRAGVFRGRRTYISSTDRLDAVYTPAIRVERRFETYFRPTWLTRADGTLSEELVDDIGDPSIADSVSEQAVRN